MAINFTDEQKEAIRARGRTLLVSAAAGSGKTATLTERIIASLTEEEHPLSLSRLLVATFTVEAANDMKKKIGKRLAEVLEASPHNAHLRKQELLLPSAQISTIDSFCVRLLRTNAEAAGISSSFRIADTAEGALLSSMVMEGLLDELYAGKCPALPAEEFLPVADALCGPKDDATLGELLLSLYDNVRHDIRGVEALAEAAALLEENKEQPFFSTPFGREVRARYAERLRDVATAETTLADALSDSSENTTFQKRLLFCRSEAEELLAYAARLLEDAVPPPPPLLQNGERIPAPRKEGLPPENALLGTLHSLAGGILKELRAQYFSMSGEALCRFLSRHAGASRVLYRLLLLFDARLEAEKERRHLLDFLDIERRTYALLIKDGERTPLAKELAAGYDAIYIDEFQDVNALQYGIFSAIAREDNLFMVGDIKQCIYAFRHSDPAIFARLRAAYAPLDTQKASTPATQFFTMNFRSDKPIIDYVNRVAGRLLAVAGGAPYGKEDELCFGKAEAGIPCLREKVETHLFERPARSSEQAGEELPPSQEECLYIRGEITRLLREGRKADGSPIRPSDIVLLFRTSRTMEQYAEALRGVAEVAIAGDSDFFLNPEVLLALALLYTVDNPQRDIYLAAALVSPIFGFDLGELTDIRQEEGKGLSLYDALCAYTERKDFKKGRYFLAMLAKWRRMAEGETVGDLVLQIFEDTGLFFLSGKGASPHHDSLFRFYQYARSFEASSYEGLYSFISYINSAIEKKKTLAKPMANAAKDAIRFMTMHAAKGLEFPVVFLVSQDKPFNMKSLTPPLLYDRAYGAVIRLGNEDGALEDNPLRRLVALRIKEGEHEEEIRLLYVALTRARERLYVTASVSGAEEKTEEAALLRYLPARWFYLSQSRASAWLLGLLGGAPDAPLTLHAAGDTADAAGAAVSDSASLGGEETPHAAAIEAELKARLSFSYPDSALTTLPEKLSVSRLSPRVLDGADEEELPLTLPPEYRPIRPRFLTGKERDSAALAGTATHLFMQFADYRRLKESGVDAECARLVEQKFLHPEDAARVRRDEITAFLASPLFARLEGAPLLRRELRFHVALPAADFTEDEEKKAALAGHTLLLQGVMDCVIEEADGYVILDYKTDRVPADRQKARALLLERHRTQLSYYAAAGTRLYGKPPKEVLLYSLALAETLKLP